METVRFNKSGGPITATITSGYAQPGSYRLRLKEPSTGKKLLDKKGNFKHSDDDTYKLLIPAIENDGKIVNVIVTLILSSPNNYNVQITFNQDNKIIGTFPQEGNSATNPVILEFLISLKGDE